jgi:hypothetical protein
VPLEFKAYAASTPYASPMIGPVNHTRHIKVDLSVLTVDEVDADGYLKPGVLLKDAGGLGVLVGAAAAPPLVVVEATKLPLATIPPTNTTLGTETGDCFVAVATHGVVNRDIAEDNLGRAYTANELTSFVTAGSHLALTTT